MFITVGISFSKKYCFSDNCYSHYVCCQVYFVDYGNTSIVTKNDIQECISKDEQQELENEHDAAIECVLSEVQPSPIHDIRGKWTQDANKTFVEYCKDTPLRAKVCSEVVIM